VPEYCTCGAQLPPDARFCHKCGRPLFDYPSVEEDPAPAYAPPAAPPPKADIGFRNRLAVRIGLTTAVIAIFLFSLPLPALGAFLRLVWFVVAGFFAAYLYRRRTGDRLSIRDGARLGWITGVFASAIASVFLAASVVMITGQGEWLAIFRKQFAANDPNADQLAHMLENPTTLAIFLLFALFLMFVLCTSLSIAGGALCAKVLDKEGS